MGQREDERSRRERSHDRRQPSKRTTRSDDPVAVGRRRFLKAGGVAGVSALPAVGALGSLSRRGQAGHDADAVVFHRDFDELDPGPWTVAEDQWGEANPWSFDTEYTRIASDDGDPVLRTTFPAWQAGTGNGGTDGMVALPRHFDELFLGYRVKFGPGFRFDNGGGKLPGLIGSADGVYAVTGGDDPTGTNGWSARMMWRDPADGRADHGQVMFYVYHPDQPGTYGENMLWSDGPDGQVHFERDTWHTVEHRIRMNTPGENDGRLEGWFDGAKAFERRNLRFRDVPDLGINRLYVSVFFGGGNSPKWAHDRDESISFDDFVVSRAPIWTDDATPTATATTAQGPPPLDGTDPHDLDDDGRYEDLTGNGEVDNQDVVAYFQNMRDGGYLATNRQFFDYTDNGSIDYQDLIQLFGRI